MRMSFFIGLFVILLVLSTMALPVISSVIKKDLLNPSQKIGNVGTFGDGTVALLFPGLNNSYLQADPMLMEKNNKTIYYNKKSKIANIKCDIIILGDSFTFYQLGLSNNICRISNKSALVFDLHELSRLQIDYCQLLDNLINSGFVQSSGAKYIILEQAGRTPKTSFYINRSKNSFIVSDGQVLDLWLKKGNNLIYSLNNDKTINKVPLLSIPSNLSWNMTWNFGDPCKITTYAGEPALFEFPMPDNMVTAVFPNIHIGKNATFISEIGLNPRSWKEGTTDGVQFQVFAREKKGHDKKIYSLFIPPDEGFRLISVPLDAYCNRTIDITLKTHYNRTADWDMAYWVNPTILNASFFEMDRKKNNPASQKVINIASSKNPRTIVHLLNSSPEISWNNTWHFGDPCKITTFLNEPALFEFPIPDAKVKAKFYGLEIENNSSFLTKIGLDPSSWINWNTDGVIFKVIIDDGIKKNQVISTTKVLPYEEFKVLFIPLNQYAGKTISLTLKTEYNKTADWDMAYWINPVILNAKSKNEKSKNGSLLDYCYSFPAMIYQMIHKFHLNDPSLLDRIWSQDQKGDIFTVKDICLNSAKNYLNLPFNEWYNKVHLNRRVHSSNVEYDTVYYSYSADIVRSSYSHANLSLMNDNLNKYSENLRQINCSLIFIVPPDSSHLFSEYIRNPSQPSGRLFYEDIRNLSKNYTYIDAYGILKDKSDNGELDLYPIGTTHWAPKAGNYIAEETVNCMNFSR